MEVEVEGSCDTCHGLGSRPHLSPGLGFRIFAQETVPCLHLKACQISVLWASVSPNVSVSIFKETAGCWEIDRDVGQSVTAAGGHKTSCP